MICAMILGARSRGVSAATRPAIMSPAPWTATPGFSKKLAEPQRRLVGQRIVQL
jgi:hypothetical protein